MTRRTGSGPMRSPQTEWKTDPSAPTELAGRALTAWAKERAESAINADTYRLYGLTKEEVELVENG